MRHSIALLALVLAGCARHGASPRLRCDAGPSQVMVGALADDAGRRKAQRLAGARTTRVVSPGMIVTTEYRYDRLTIDVDAANRIQRIACG